MSRLEELIQELCPDGVEYKPLKEFSHYSTERIDANDVDAENYVGVDNLLPDKQGKTTSGYVPEEGKVIAFYEGDILIGNIRPYLKKIWRATHDGGTNGDVLVICSDKSIDSEYLFYCLSSDRFFYYDMQHAKGAKMPRGDKGAIMQFEVPVPPLEVQREIVRVLDNFTLLRAELSAELSARRKQYEYYRDELLTFGDDVPRISLSEVANVFRGEYITKKGTMPGEIPVILGGQEPAYYIDKYNHTGEIVAVARSGVSAGFVSYWNEPIFITDGFGYEAKPGITTPKFLYYSLKQREKELNNMKRGAGVPHVSGEALSLIQLPIPNLDIQSKVVSVLDNFESICNDISTGLPAEIEARTKQYEYYRDKLLSFKRKETA